MLLYNNKNFRSPTLHSFLCCFSASYTYTEKTSSSSHLRSLSIRYDKKFNTQPPIQPHPRFPFTFLLGSFFYRRIWRLFVLFFSWTHHFCDAAQSSTLSKCHIIINISCWCCSTPSSVPLRYTFYRLSKTHRLCCHSFFSIFSLFDESYLLDETRRAKGVVLNNRKKWCLYEIYIGIDNLFLGCRSCCRVSERWYNAQIRIKSYTTEKEWPESELCCCRCSLSPFAQARNLHNKIYISHISIFLVFMTFTKSFLSISIPRLSFSSLLFTQTHFFPRLFLFFAHIITQINRAKAK